MRSFTKDPHDRIRCNPLPPDVLRSNAQEFYQKWLDLKLLRGAIPNPMHEFMEQPNSDTYRKRAKRYWDLLKGEHGLYNMAEEFENAREHYQAKRLKMKKAYKYSDK